MKFTFNYLIIATILFAAFFINEIKAQPNSANKKQQVEPKSKNKKTSKNPTTTAQPQTSVAIPDSTNIKPAMIEGLMINYGEFSTETMNYKMKYPNENFGGVIGKEKLQSLLYSIPQNSEWVNFYFGESPEMKKFVMFIESDLKSDGMVIRNSVFCPEHCADNQLIVNYNADGADLNIVDTIVKPIIVVPDGEFVPFGLFQGEVSTFKGKYPNQTFGGVFGKTFLQNFLNSISPDVRLINFYFAETSDLKKYIILIPAGLTSDGYIIKNAEYCPDHCKDNE
jgi:hypothetical protein